MHWVPPNYVHVVLNATDALSPHEFAARENIRYAACYEIFVGQAAGMVDVTVALCRPRGRAASQSYSNSSSSGGSVAMCIPPLYNIRAYNNPGRPGLASILETHLRHHEALGVEHTFVYTAETLDERTLHQMDSMGTVTLLHMGWVHQLKVWSRAQNWMINDCIHLAASRGYEWALSVDLDEFVVFPLTLPGAPPAAHPSWTRGWLLALAAEARKQQQQVVTFGSRPSEVQPHEVLALLTGVQGSFAKRLPQPECMAPLGEGTVKTALPALSACVGWQGRRKHLSHASSVWVANIHNVNRCKPSLVGDQTQWHRAKPCHVLDLDANSASVLHVGKSARAPDAVDDYYAQMPGRG